MKGKKSIYRVDIDDTILFSAYDEKSEYGYTLIGKNVELIEKINKLYDEGNTIIIDTARHWNHLPITKIQLEQACVKYHTLTMGQPYADFIINDKSVTPEDFLEVEF